MTFRYSKAAAIGLLGCAAAFNAQAGEGNHHAALFVGITDSKIGMDETAGIEYEFRTPLWDRKIGIGLVAERIMGDMDASIFVAGVVIHPWKDLKINVSAGQEQKKGNSYDVTRAGVGYDFHYNNISYGPVYNYDDIEGSVAHVVGLAVGVGF